MSYNEVPLRRVPLWLYCDCAGPDRQAEHDLFAQVGQDAPRVGELLAVVVRCRDCGETRVLD